MDFANTFQTIVELIFQNWFTRMVNDWLTELTELTGAVDDLVGTALHIEHATALTAGFVSESALNTVFSSVYFILVGLLVLKLCYKGYKIYVLELDGEAETFPSVLLKNATYALCVAVAFPIIYDFTAEMVIYFGDLFFRPFSLYTMDNFIASLQGLFSDGASRTFVMIILSLVYIFAAIFLWIRMVMQGFELLIYRLGVPLAVVGLVDSDGGVWKGYLQQFLRQMATIMIQGFCAKLSIVVAASATGGTLVGSIALIIIAFKMPKMISSLVVSGGGSSGALHILSMTARTFVRGG